MLYLLAAALSYSMPARLTSRGLRVPPPTACAAEVSVAAGLDVVALTKEFLATGTGYYSAVDADALDEAFVFRAPSIGPLNKPDYINTMTNLQTYVGYPDISPNAFGFTVDPDEPLKCIFWTRASGTFSSPWNPFGAKLDGIATIQPNNKRAQLPTECYSITFEPSGKVKFLTAGYVVNRFEGNSTPPRLTHSGLHSAPWLTHGDCTLRLVHSSHCGVCTVCCSWRPWRRVGTLQQREAAADGLHCPQRERACRDKLAGRQRGSEPREDCIQPRRPASVVLGGDGIG
jgi:hypothetical protein